MEEINPYLLLQIDTGQVQCALWRLHQGETAVAMFLTADAASAYRAAAGLEGWQVFQPAREALLELFEAHIQAGVRLGVLDPDLQQGRRLFDLQAVVRSARAAKTNGSTFLPPPEE